MVTKEEFTDALKATLDSMRQQSESNQEVTQKIAELLSSKGELPKEVVSFCEQYPELCRQNNDRLDRLLKSVSELSVKPPEDDQHDHTIEEALTCPTCGPQWLGELERLGYSKQEEEKENRGKVADTASPALFDPNDKRLRQWGLTYLRNIDFVEDKDGKVKAQFLGDPDEFQEHGCELVCDENGCNWVCEEK